jgi:acyl-CoA thioester hydrolase
LVQNNYNTRGLEKMQYVFELNMKVRDYECDMQGIVNNSVYLSYLEHARHEFLASKGIIFKELVDKDIILMASRIEIDFKSSLKSGDVFSVKINLEKKYANLIMHQDIYTINDNRLCARAKVSIVCKINGKVTRGDFFNHFLV